MADLFSHAAVQETSRKAYREEVEPTLGERQAAVLAALGSRSLTNSELARALRWQINTVTPRIFELRKLALVEFHEKRACGVTGRTAMAWRRTL